MSKDLNLPKTRLGNRMQEFIKHGTGTDSRELNQTINKEINKSSTKDDIKRLVVDIPASLHREIKLFCASEGCKMNEFIRDSAIKSLEHNQETR